jgi:hypothetical protein
MNTTEHARVRRLRRRANKLGTHGYRIVPKRQGVGARMKEGWHLIANVTNTLVAPLVETAPVPLDDIEALLERLEQEAEAPKRKRSQP